MELKHIAKAVVGGIGLVLAAIVGLLPLDSPWKALLEAVLIVGGYYGIWRVPNSPMPVQPAGVNQPNHISPAPDAYDLP